MQLQENSARKYDYFVRGYPSLVADKLNDEAKHYKEIPAVCNVTQQQVIDNYYQVKLEVKRLIAEEVERLKTQSVI